jgi:hypothetical protein
MKRKLAGLITLMMLVLAALAPRAQAHDDLLHLSEWRQRMLEAIQEAGGTPTVNTGEQKRNVSLVGALALSGFNADVWGYNGFAYVGSWGLGLDACPAAGVRIIDLADPAKPTLIGAVAEIPGTTQEDVEVTRINTRYFHGDLLVTGIQTCGETGAQGIDLWDVSDPYSPKHLGFWDSVGAFGVHELTLFQRGNRAYVAAATPFSEFVIGQGDFRLVDVTDPRNPVQVGEWGLTDIGVEPDCHDFGVYCTYDHSAAVSKDGRLVVLSYWDYGAVMLDISDPSQPRYLGRTPYPAGSDGDTHSVAFARGDNVLITADEDWSPLFGGDATWGYMRVWDIKNPSHAQQLSTFATPNTLSGRADGFYSIHNPVVRGNTVYTSWYSDGLRVLDISRLDAPREIGSYVPPGAEDPFGFFPPVPMVWGVHVDRSLILLSDINGGLYVLKHVPPR